MHPLDPIFKPKSIAVVGASRQTGTIGHEILHNLIRYGFHGKLFPVNPKADFIHSLKAFSSLGEIPDAVDLAVIVVPRDLVLGEVGACAQKGVKGLVVITSGFGETGEEGQRLQTELEERVQRYGMRMLGPNCMGMINTDPAISLDATFAPALPLAGRIAFVSQSGALGVVILNLARHLDIGFSYFVSTGNKADISGNDLLLYWEDDPGTDLILMYLESFRNPRRFLEIARRITRHKPIVVVKAGRTAAGARAASSHTGVLVEGQGLDAAADALLAQSGAIRVETLDALFDFALAFTRNPLPHGNRLGILTNAGGPAIMATDAAINLGLAVGKFEDRTMAELRRLLPPAAAVGNPVDMTPKASPDQYAACARAILEDETIESLLLICVPPLMLNVSDVVDGLERLRREFSKPILTAIMDPAQSFRDLKQKQPGNVALYHFPEPALGALAAMERYRRWREHPAGEVREFTRDRGTAESLLAAARARGDTHLPVADAMRLLGCYGIPVARWQEAASIEELEVVAKEVCFPVVLKASSPGIVHKTEAGGVVTDLRTPDDLVRAARHMEEKLGRRGSEAGGEPPLRFVVQEYVTGGREVIVGMAEDVNLGPLLMFGLGGIHVEVLRDVVFRVPPLTDVDAAEMIRQIRGRPLLEGVRGEPPVDFGALAEILERFSRLVEELPGVADMEVNPLVVYPEGKNFRAVDARIRLADG